MLRSSSTAIHLRSKKNNSRLEDICGNYIKLTRQYQNEIDNDIKNKEWRSSYDDYDTITYTYIGNDKSKKGWKKELNTVYLTTTWIYEAPPESREKEISEGKVGTDGRVVIKFYGSQSYNFIRTEDFIDRGYSLCDTVLHHTIKERFIKDEITKRKLRNWIIHVKSVFKKKMIKQCNIKVDKMQGANSINYYDLKEKKAKEIIKELIFVLAKEIQRVSGYQYSLAEIIAEIGECEKFQIMDRGQPVHINVEDYFYDKRPKDTKTNNYSYMLSAQFPQGKKTTPSNFHYRDFSTFCANNPILGNHVVDLTGVVKSHNTILSPRSSPTSSTASTTSGTNTGPVSISIAPLVEINEHDAYSPSENEDELERMYYSYCSVKENISQIAVNIAKNGEQGIRTSNSSSIIRVESDDDIPDTYRKKLGSSDESVSHSREAKSDREKEEKNNKRKFKHNIRIKITGVDGNDEEEEETVDIDAKEDSDKEEHEETKASSGENSRIEEDDDEEDDDDNQEDSNSKYDDDEDDEDDDEDDEDEDDNEEDSDEGNSLFSDPNNENEDESYQPEVAISPRRSLREIFTKRISLDTKLKLSLSTMMMLTPKKTDKDKKSADQLSESAMALNMFRYNFNQDFFKMSIDNNDYSLDVDISFMNMPTNFLYLKHANPDQFNLQNRINAKGFYDYYNRITSVLNLVNSLEHNYENEILLLSAQVLLTLDSNSESPYKQSHSNRSIAQLTQEINSFKDSLREYYSKIKACLIEYMKCLNDLKLEFDPTKVKTLTSKIQNLKAEYHKYKVSINSVESQLHEKYSLIHESRKKMFNSNNNQNDLARINKLIDAELIKDDLTEEKRNTYILLKRFYRMLDMFYNDKYLDNVYHFQVNYLLSLQQVGDKIDAFCDDDQDDTKWLNIMILAYKKFNQDYGRDPNMDDDNDRQKFIALLPRAKQISASLDNCYENYSIREMKPDYKSIGLNDSVISNRFHNMGKTIVDEAANDALWKDMSYKRAGLIGFIVGIIVGVPVVSYLTLGTGTVPYVLGLFSVTATTGMTIGVSIGFSGLSAGFYAFVSVASLKISRLFSRSESKPKEATVQTMVPTITISPSTETTSSSTTKQVIQSIAPSGSILSISSSSTSSHNTDNPAPAESNETTVTRFQRSLSDIFEQMKGSKRPFVPIAPSTPVNTVNDRTMTTATSSPQSTRHKIT